MQQKTKNMKTAKILIAPALMMALTCSVYAGKTSGGSTGGTTGAFNFTYNVGTVANYHAYGLACQVGAVSPRPAGTIVLGNWWVWDLGPVSGVGTVTCPKPVVPKGQVASVVGSLMFADANDLGGQAFAYPVVDVEIFTPKFNNGYASIQVITPKDGDADDAQGYQLYFGVPRNPFAWDISAYVWNVEPATW